jgi:hypothetical protein
LCNNPRKKHAVVEQCCSWSTAREESSVQGFVSRDISGAPLLLHGQGIVYAESGRQSGPDASSTILPCGLSFRSCQNVEFAPWSWQLGLREYPVLYTRLSVVKMGDQDFRILVIHIFGIGCGYPLEPAQHTEGGSALVPRGCRRVTVVGPRCSDSTFCSR